MAVPPPRNRIVTLLLVTMLALMMPLAGCLDKDDGDVEPAGPDPITTGGDDGADEEENETVDLDDLKEKEKEGGPVERVPAAHYHHYWGEPALESAILFDDEVELDSEACEPGSQRQQRPQCLGTADGGSFQAHVGSAVFTPEDDGNDIETLADDAIQNGKSDTVLLGTSEIRVKVEWDDANIGELYLFYKAANSGGQWLPATQEEYLRITSGEETVIKLTPRMADPAHQIAVSRWGFMLVANGGPEVNGQEWPMPVKMASGPVSVMITIVNGGENFIDPPHPDPWEGKDLLRYKPIEGSLSVLAGKEYVDRQGATDIKIPDDDRAYARIVPTGILLLKAKVWVNVTQDAYEDMAWGFRYHGADTIDYQKVEGKADGDAMVYEIQVTDTEVDPPYEKSSYFRFQIFPLTAGEEDVGAFEADYVIQLEAQKDPTFTYYF